MNIDNDIYKKFATDIYTLGLIYDRNKLIAILNHLGPSVHDRDASLVACSDENETNYIKKEFLIGKLGLDTNDERLDDAIARVCELLGTSNRHKTRTSFYYLLMAILEVDYRVLN